MKIIRNNASYPGFLNGLQVFVDNFVSTSGGAITFETHSPNVLFGLAFNKTDATVLDGVIANSSTYSGTKKVTFTAVAGKSYQCLIICGDNYATTKGTVSTTGTIDDAEIY